MWDAIWYLGFPMFAINVFGAPYKSHYEDRDGAYDPDKFDVFYDQRQNGTENYKLSVDGLSLVWSPNSLLAAAALLEPALYGEYPETNVDIILGPEELSKSEQEPGLEVVDNKPSLGEKPVPAIKNNAPESPPTVLIIDSNKNSENQPETPTNIPANFNKRKLRIPGLLRPFLRKRALPTKADHQKNKSL